jgi:peptidoglycan-associated lipoprotein
MVGGMIGLSSMTACHKPKYPLCKNDAGCAKRNEVCVNHHCQECRDDTQCEMKHPGEHFVCQSGKCTQNLDCESNQDCLLFGPHMVCRNHQCQPECTHNEDCQPPAHCEQHRCTNTCQDDSECGTDAHCENGQCKLGRSNVLNFSGAYSICRPDAGSAENAWVKLNNIHFAFDHYDLNDDMRRELDEVAMCMRILPANAHVIIEGHCDDRGTQEYNLALGEKRANAIFVYLRNAGVPESIMSTRSKGENEPLCSEHEESCWSQNRRGQFIQEKN